jgi:hypothetical protein
MLLGYTTESSQGSISPAYTVSATPLTEIDVYSIKPGASRRSLVYSLQGQGRLAGGTTLSGVDLNFKLWTTASTAGSTVTPSPDSVIASIAAVTVARIGTGGGVNAVTPGTGGGTYRGGIGFSGSGPGLWVANTFDSWIDMDGGYAGSLDIYSLSGTASVPYSFVFKHYE